jgi:hypothetical protein
MSQGRERRERQRRSRKVMSLRREDSYISEDSVGKNRRIRIIAKLTD